MFELKTEPGGGTLTNKTFAAVICLLIALTSSLCILLNLIFPQVTMAFVIDSSSSMANDLGHVKKYIRQLLVEQTRSGVDATYIVTTFSDPNIGQTRVCSFLFTCLCNECEDFYRIFKLKL